MGLLSTPQIRDDDPRIQTDAYISVREEHLYEVIGSEKTVSTWKLHVRNCVTEHPMWLTAREVLCAKLERAAPAVVTVPEGWGVGVGVVPVEPIESD